VSGTETINMGCGLNINTECDQNVRLCRRFLAAEVWNHANFKFG